MGLSFVKTPQDVASLHDELVKRDAAHLGVTLEIESKSAFEQLPAMLLTALRSPPSRAEVSDAAMGGRAEWVMLNKARTSSRRSSSSETCCAGWKRTRRRSAR
ncbi:hypothetical protein L6R52_29835 [Myxococcota bacterium]|nr:hypothetical protein [Myxococcota bacterium]